MVVQYFWRTRNTSLCTITGVCLSVCVSRIVCSHKKAEFFINEVLQHRQKINNSKLRRERYNLVRVIKENYDMTKLFSSKVKNYKLYATIYKLFEIKYKHFVGIKSVSFVCADGSLLIMLGLEMR